MTKCESATGSGVFLEESMDLYTLDREEILQIYETLVRDFAKAGDPITPTGIRDDHLLESAVSKHSGPFARRGSIVMPADGRCRFDH